MQKKYSCRASLYLGLTALALAVPVLQGCFPVVATGVVVGALVAADRRTVATQGEDTEIELKATGRVNDKYTENVHFNFTSFNHKVLITGEVPNEATKADVTKIVQEIPNVQGVYNELAIGPTSSLAARSTDTYITSKVKARQVDIKEFSANHVKVVTEAGIVYLMGMVTQKEAQAAIQVARTTSDVKKVVSLFETLSQEKAKEIDNMPHQPAAPAPTAS